MKKTFLIVLSLCLLLALPACSSADESAGCTCDTSNALSQEAQKYVGRWEPESNPALYVQFLGNGKVYFVYAEVANIPYVAYGEWFVNGDTIVLTYMSEGTGRARLFQMDGQNLIYNGVTYTKVN